MKLLLIKEDEGRLKRWRKRFHLKDLEITDQEDWLQDALLLKCKSFVVSLRRCKDGSHKVLKVGAMRAFPGEELKDALIRKADLVAQVQENFKEALNRWMRKHPGYRVVPGYIKNHGRGLYQ